MEEKKFDPYQFVGFVLIAIIMTWMLMNQQPVEEVAGEAVVAEEITTTPVETRLTDSIQQLQLQASYGSFADLVVPKKNSTVSLENEVLSFEFSTKGGQMTKSYLKGYTNYLDQPLNLVKENQYINFSFTTLDGRTLNTADLNFTPELSTANGAEVLVLKAALRSGQWIAFRYALSKDDFMVDFSIRSEGMQRVINQNIPQTLQWELTALRNSRSIEYENRYTELTYGYEGEKVNELSISGDDEEEVADVQWLGYKQHFFNSILVPAQSFDTVAIASESIEVKEGEEQKFTKKYSTLVPLKSTGELAYAFKWYFGPSEYAMLAKYELGIEKSINFGWGIFGWINKSIFIPLFNFLSSFLPFGIAIIVMTIIVRLAMSPVTYKSYVSQIKMKVLKPEVEEITKKHKDDAVKRQQETMALYNKAGASPMSGCLPALLQLPVFYALFSFFPVAFALRQKSFLWADDLSSYDSVYELPFNIPFYGDHISLFPILASIAIFFYTMMTAGQQQAPQQPGMPNMKVIMYLMPLMMLFFFNNYASGLSLYYFVSNVLTIVLMLVIKNFVISEDKIFAQIEENKKKPKKSGGFTARLQKAMEEAEKQQKSKGKR
ncbi:membrane protein insertase YidC [Flavobacteriaceae bacterium]|nr:membrane protein insertase YidC [Flavobacteriaceae bacterium]MDA9886892.1 membrane protein insertase YidC [Flavobacteriaceae bacterium]MDB4112688.1 membrane protein insertase YidC [Flavobacteriaceae bacterium]MDB9821692.1 membrane protein insertase YidC [Flavobacteriaceae bacterium]MDB9823772.1 membrane protein insertase YidC [Flavobacteriaceae bacterium]